ncbi:hypothetical protein DET57_114172 [Klebsiella oxytoca]|uniref:Uncharacterized protein n=1 Tax=Klebsiella oxytoca TaxID=571 RepID=A0A318FPL1_KLEOX|nr:hypothetical protein [Klebsiella oxytoca]PXW42180.1 hypothetical protein DET57_114172 [Klebsiella oxytoca]
MKTTSLLLDTDTWDLVVDELGNIATVDNPYACAQDVATACLAIRGECIYEKDTGVPYSELLNVPSSPFRIAASLQIEALRLPYITKAAATLANDKATRKVSGVIAVVDSNGIASTIQQ